MLGVPSIESERAQRERAHHTPPLPPVGEACQSDDPRSGGGAWGGVAAGVVD